MQILKQYLDDTYDFQANIPISDLQDILKEVRAIYNDFNFGKPVGLDKFAELALYFMKKAKDRKFVRFTKIKDFDFYALLEKALETESHPFRCYMLYLKKNQGWVGFDDFVKIMARFKVISLPFDKDLELNPTAGTQV